MTRLLITLLLLCTMGAKAQTSQTLADFNARKAVLTHGHLFDIFNRTMTDGERDAMRFLYAYMPVNDIADYDGDFFLNQVRATLNVRTQVGWQVPDEVFRHFVLPIRVNNENLDTARLVFQRELLPRVRGRRLYDAVLEVNHWCHEKANYQPSDARTSSPLATVRTPGAVVAKSLRSWWQPCARWASPRARSILRDGHIPTTIMPGSKPGSTAAGISLVPASPNRYSTWAGSMPQPAAAC